MAAELDVPRFYERLGAIHSAFAKHRCVLFPFLILVARPRTSRVRHVLQQQQLKVVLVSFLAGGREARSCRFELTGSSSDRGMGQ